MHIIAGHLKGLSLHGIEGVMRPMPARVRKALFDHLTHHGEIVLEERVVLDGFSGSGALGLESLSRGAREAIFMEQSSKAVHNLRKVIEHLPEDFKPRVHAMRMDVTRKHLRGENLPPADMTFLCPPWMSGLGARAAHALHEGGWLAAASYVMIEVHKDETCMLDKNMFAELYERAMGEHRLIFYRVR